MADLMHSLVVIIWIVGSLMALVAGLSLLLFVVGLLRFIRHERRLAANWDRLRAMRGIATTKPRPVLSCRNRSSDFVRDRALRGQR